MRTMWIKGVAIMLLFTFSTMFCLPVSLAQEGGGAPAPYSSDDSQGGNPKEAGLQAASWVLTIPYGVGKVVFAILGGVTGGLTYVFSGGNLD
ncbi:MAG: hypothetical protein L0Z52_07975, partial [Acidobacteria bacterium]|nr:hypothetical protein [Acidobacteriota bacterium]